VSTKAMIAKAMWKPSAASSVALPFGRVRLTAPIQRPFEGVVCPQAAGFAGGTFAMGTRIAVADLGITAQYHNEKFRNQHDDNKNSDTRRSGSTVWRPSA
jgi:hypothetical protein